jgi:endogenous inhibitor of DNA gyrase (YacG/DUF329 family)
MTQEPAFLVQCPLCGWQGVNHAAIQVPFGLPLCPKCKKTVRRTNST